MSLKQLFVAFHHQLLRLRYGGNLLRRPVAKPFLRTDLPPKDPVHLQQQPVAHKSSSWSLASLMRSLYSISPLATHHVSGYLRRLAPRPGRTVAPLLGFIAAFLQESKTEEYKIQAACVAVRDEANEFSKSAVDQKPRLDLSAFHKISDLEFGEPLGKGCNAAVYEARLKKKPCAEFAQNYDLAVKVLFNYSMHSSAEEVSRLFENELLPSRLRHLNIVDVFQALVDEVPRLWGSDKLFPSAMPQRLNPAGLGRSHTMFVLMNKYSCTLREDLLARGAYELNEGLAVIAQILEGVVKLGREKIAHRDIKSDNVLVSKGEDGKVVRAVISDFGCSLKTLRLNFTTSHISRGGNRALMAPEVLNVEAGLFSVIDYSRSDLWAVGTLAYEIFTGFNPFFEGVFRLNSATYHESQLPSMLPDNPPLDNLIHSMLHRDPAKRPSPALAATSCHLLLWDFPMEQETPSTESVHLWIMRLCVKLICGSRDNPMHRALLATFLKRCSLREILEAWKLLTAKTRL